MPARRGAAAAAAVALLKGKKPKSNTFRLNGKKKEPTQTIPVVWITKANYKRLFTDGFLKKSQVCIGDVQAVLQVTRSIVRWEAPPRRLPPSLW